MISVKQSPDHSVTGQWEVETEGSGGQKETHVFDAVIVCTGHFTQPHLPLKDFPGTRKLAYYIESLLGYKALKDLDSTNARHYKECQSHVTDKVEIIINIYRYAVACDLSIASLSQVLKALKAGISTVGNIAVPRVYRGKEWW